MEHLQYRSKARIIAITDLVLTGISTLSPLLLFLIAIMMTSLRFSEPYDPQSDGPQNSMILWVWILFVMTATLIITQLVAGFKLVNATQLGRDPMEAGRLSRFWRNISIVFTAMLVIATLRRKRSSRMNYTAVLQLVALIGDVFVWCCIIFRMIGIVLVQKFINETDQIAASRTILPSQNGQIPIPMTVMSSGGVVYTYIPPQQGPNTNLGYPHPNQGYPPLNPGFLPQNQGYPPGAFHFQPPTYNEVMRQPYEKQWNNNPISQC